MSRESKEEQKLSPTAHWIYVAAVMGGGFILNLLLMVILAGSSS
jgi:hypothetical protein